MDRRNTIAENSLATVLAQLPPAMLTLLSRATTRSLDNPNLPQDTAAVDYAEILGDLLVVLGGSAVLANTANTSTLFTPASTAQPIQALICRNCNTPFQLPPPSQRWYSITVGRRIGYVRGWSVQERLTTQVPGAKKRFFLTRDEARAHFLLALQHGQTVIVDFNPIIQYLPVPQGYGQLIP
ncbi:hypothetical protein VKT23_020395 [Stygiomarasmius scandens]|uniref:Uncharacterized protein n=1 Tax=Marasmiellus scandens TaxID=2682957 RepID=A0ABR1IJE0_9AGAR